MKRILHQQPCRLQSRWLSSSRSASTLPATHISSRSGITIRHYSAATSSRSIAILPTRRSSSAFTSLNRPSSFNSCKRTFASDSTSTPSILIWVEHDEKGLHSSTYNVLTAAKQLASNANITLLLTGHNLTATLTDAAAKLPVNKVVTCQHESLTHHLPEPLAEAVTSVLKGGQYTHLVVPTTTNGRNLLPRVGVALDSQPVTDVVEVKSADTFVRPIYAGNALQTVQLLEPIKLLSIRPTSFDKTTAATSSSSSSSPAAIEPVDPPSSLSAAAAMSDWVKEDLTVSDRPDLSTARVVVSGGRGLKSADNFGMLVKLADVLHGAVGASRAAVDAGMAANEQQVGQTGKVVAPELYIAVGISGAIQHLAGMKESKVIVAVNKDAEAPIFQVADYGLVGDLFQIVPQLTEKLSKK